MSLNQRRAGAVLSYVGLAVNAVVAFVYVPLLLSFLTTQEYGVYELIGSIIAYLSVMDMGLSTTLNRFYVRERTLGDERRVQNLLAMAAIIYLLLALLAIVVGFALNAALDPLLGDSFTPGELELAHQMMFLVIINCAVVLPGNWFLALINANERFVFARTLSIVKHVLQVVVVLVVLNWHSSAMAVLAVQVVLNVCAVIAYAVYAKTNLHVQAKLHKWEWAVFRSLFAFSFFILLNMVFDQVFWKTGQLVLGAVVGASAVAVYGVACKLITAGYMQVSTGVTSVFLPKLTAISTHTDDMAEINDLFCRIGRIQAILVWGVFAAFITLGQEFVYLWAGSDFAEAYACVVVLMFGLSISLIQNLGISILQAKNKMAFRSVVYIALAVLDVVISIPVSQAYGVVGCAVVAAALLLLGTGPVMNAYYSKVIGIDIPRFFRTTLPLVAPALITGVAVYAFGVLAGFEWSWDGFALKCVVFLCLYIAVLWLFFLNAYEKGLVFDMLGKLTNGRFKRA